MTNEIVSIELHDGLLKEIKMDFISNSISIFVDVYLDSDSSKRTSLKISFEQVSSVSNLINFDNLRENVFAGNINYWVPAKRKKDVTYIYLTGGCISITAKKISIDPS